MKTAVTAMFCIALVCGAAAAAERDPLASARWGDMQKSLFQGARVVFDERVKVSAPAIAENPLNVPVRVDASGLPEVREVLVFADFNPIVKALAFSPLKAQAKLAFRLKLQQSSPVRAAARTGDGVWHVGGTWVNTTGGGCTLPSTGSASPIWQQRLNEVSARLWEPNDAADGGERLRLSIIHPMDTGLAAGIPVFHIEDLRITGADGEELMRIQPFEPVAENPLFTIELPPGQRQERIRINGRDNNGNLIDSWVQR